MSMVAGVSDNDPLETVRLLLSDPQGLQRMLGQIKSAQDQAQAVVNLAGPANEILTLRAKMAEDLAKRKDILTDAQEEAELIVSEARAEAKRLVTEARVSADKLTADLKLVETEKRELNAQAKAALLDAKKRQEEATEVLRQGTLASAELKQTQAAMVAKQDELTKRLGRLEEARAALKLMLE